MSWLEQEEIEAFQKRDADNGLKASSDVSLVLELAKRLGLEETDSDVFDDFFKIIPGHNCPSSFDFGIRFGHGVGYSNFVAEFYFDERGKLAAHGVWE